MGFERRQADNWRRNVPGARWFKADLHIHTIDDAPGGRAKAPDGIAGHFGSPEWITAYARAFLQGAIDNGVQVLGLTPHRPRFENNGDLSATWQIVEEWNNGCDDEGVPFRERIYAVFPGFAPRMEDGRGSLHLIFLFDPEIGKHRYLQLFDLVMGGKDPYLEDGLQRTDKSPDEVFALMRDNWKRSSEDAARNGSVSWEYIVLAPDVFSETGLFGTASEHVERSDFCSGEIAALELPRTLLSKEALVSKPRVKEYIERHNLPFFHSSAAYTVHDIGERHVWVKMASPIVEALRQAAIASTTRMRIGHELDNNGNLRDLKPPPDAELSGRPWLKSVTVDGKASFFGQSMGSGAPTRFEFSPDLTCIIGASMTGKSTLLDGLRVYLGAPLPHDPQAKKGVFERAEELFLAGSPSVDLDCPGSDPLVAAHKRWPAEFYTQGELRRLASDHGAVEGMLARLDESETQGIAKRAAQLAGLDRDLDRAATNLDDLEERLAEAEQALEQSKAATERLKGFASAGVDDLNRASSAAAAWSDHADAVVDVANRAVGLLASVESLASLPSSDDSTGLNGQLQSQWERAVDYAKRLAAELGAARDTVEAIGVKQENTQNELRQQVDRVLAEQGIDASSISELQALNSRAALRASYQANFDSVSAEFDQLHDLFERSQEERQGIVQEQREAYDRVSRSIDINFEGRIAARRVDSGRFEPIEAFLTCLAQGGITRWWNGCEDSQRPSPAQLLDLLEADQLADVGMSKAVQGTFREQMTPSKRRQLAALRCPDRYLLEFRPDSDDYRPIEKLSGGQQVNILLSLLLEAADERPLVIDQPEDELDNRYLFETLLPTLGRLKGRRQVILATHNANIVVNGDADQVIQLDADADRGFVVASGAIEDAAVRDAIVRSVDGGTEAFRLRQLKYGF